MLLEGGSFGTEINEVYSLLKFSNDEDVTSLPIPEILSEAAPAKWRERVV